MFVSHLYVFFGEMSLDGGILLQRAENGVFTATAADKHNVHIHAPLDIRLEIEECRVEIGIIEPISWLQTESFAILRSLHLGT